MDSGLSIPADVTWRLSKGGAERQAARAGLGILKIAGSVIAFVTYRSFIGLGVVLQTLFGAIGLAIIRLGAYAARGVVRASRSTNPGVRLWTQWFMASVSGSAVGAIIGSVLGLGVGVVLGVALSGIFGIARVLLGIESGGYAIVPITGLMVGVAVFGLVIGLSQNLVLEQRLDEGTDWETASLVGYTGAAALFVALSEVAHLGIALAAGVAMTGLGLAQWSVLRRTLPGALWWVVVSAIGGALAAALGAFLFSGGIQYVVGVFVYAAFTGTGLLVLLWKPTGQNKRAGRLRPAV